MLFTEPSFLFLFLPILLLLYFLSPERARNPLLSAASLLFYAAGEWRFLPWLLGSIALNYWVAIGLGAWRGTKKAGPLLLLGILSDLVLLLVFKYAGFLVDNFNLPWQALGHVPLRVPQLVLPLGISFFTFHKISYKVDVYRGTAEVRRNPLDLALYILLFPQLIAGPIVRYHDIAGAIVARTAGRSDLAEGIRRFVLGLGKKMLIANTVAICADGVFGLPRQELSCQLAWLGVLCYTLQIYFDFSGYSDMAIGLARMFGFRFPENFDHPYIATSITEFWRCWHISLSRWFRDYLYIPLGGNRQGAARTYFNLGLVFFLCGLWHGASWNFVLWGLYHGAFLIVERVGLERVLRTCPRLVRHVYLLVAVMVGWVLFRANTLAHADAVLRAMLGLGATTHGVYSVEQYANPQLRLGLALGILFATPIRSAVRQWLDATKSPALQLGSAVAGVLGLGLIGLLAVCNTAAGTYNPFIYFRF